MKKEIICGFIIRTTQKAWQLLDESLQLDPETDIIYVRRAPADVKFKIVELLPREGP